MIIVLDFGSQTTHLIKRRLEDAGVQAKILEAETRPEKIKKLRPTGLVLSGGPSSVYSKNAPNCPPAVFELGEPVLGICYGLQLLTHALGGEVVKGEQEYGPRQLRVGKDCDLFRGVKKDLKVWLSHGDQVKKLPPGFNVVASTENVSAAAITNEQKKFYGVQFHPEVEHTEQGQKILENFAKACGEKTRHKTLNPKSIINNIREQVGSGKVLAAVSGGVDSTTAAFLAAKAVGEDLIPVYVDSGLMRKGTRERVKKTFHKMGVEARVVNAEEIFLEKLKGVVGPEEKRKVIGRAYVEALEREARKIKGVEYLLQGTIYSDVIESKGTSKADNIKSHHNVGGLPENMRLKLVEPLRHLYKDEVRMLAKKMGLEERLVNQQVFPGPGLAIRIVGEVTRERLRAERQADKIVLEELEKSGWLGKVALSFPVLTGVKSVGVKGDAREVGEVVALRIVESSDLMTADWARIPAELLETLSTRIVNEVEGVSRVVYDVTTKPPATIEWE